VPDQRPTGFHLAGLAHLTTGVAIGYTGFEGSVKEAANLVSWAALMLFAVAAAISAWWGRGRHADEPVAVTAQRCDATPEPPRPAQPATAGQLRT
jgi:hypothetical protein